MSLLANDSLVYIQWFEKKWSGSGFEIKVTHSPLMSLPYFFYWRTTDMHKVGHKECFVTRQELQDRVEEMLYEYGLDTKEKSKMENENNVNKVKVLADFAFTDLGTGIVGRMDEEGNVYDLTVKIRGRLGGHVDDYDPRDPNQVKPFNVDDLVRLRNQISKVINEAIRLNFYKDKTTRGS